MKSTSSSDTTSHKRNLSVEKRTVVKRLAPELYGKRLLGSVGLIEGEERSGSAYSGRKSDGCPVDCVGRRSMCMNVPFGEGLAL